MSFSHTPIAGSSAGLPIPASPALPPRITRGSQSVAGRVRVTHPLIPPPVAAWALLGPSFAEARFAIWLSARSSTLGGSCWVSVGQLGRYWEEVSVGFASGRVVPLPITGRKCQARV